jgi:TolB protein
MAATCLVAIAFLVAGCSPATPEPPSPTAVASANGGAPTPTGPTAPSASSGAPASSASANRPLAARGAIAVDRADGSLWLVSHDRRQSQLAAAAGSVYGLPCWSPDGSKIAVIRATGSELAVVVLDVGGGAAAPPTPRVILDNAEIQPFYLSWTPDSRSVSFLANEGGGLTLRIAPADGSAPVDGSGNGALIREGSPFYFDWIDGGHLFAHIGAGTNAFLGEIGRDGSPVAPEIKNPGDFRSPDMSGDGRYVGYVRAGSAGADEVVVAARDGSAEHAAPVYGPAAVGFGPTGDVLASIGALEPDAPPGGIPVGPLRLLDPASGATRTVLDGSVVSFAWSPDGRTIAALRVVPIPGGSTIASVSPAPTAPASPVAANQVRLTFVDVASGAIRSDPVVVPGATFINNVLAYFDQYALSHRLWAPDNSSFLLPAVDQAGTTHVDVFYPDGGDPVQLDGDTGFWSP